MIPPFLLEALMILKSPKVIPEYNGIEKLVCIEPAACPSILKNIFIPIVPPLSSPASLIIVR